MYELPAEPEARLGPDTGSLSIGILGAGQFSRSFATLWARHPQVDRLVITDTIAERAEALAAQHSNAEVMSNFEAMLESDLDAVAIFTQRWTHAPFVLAALEAGKHVYSAVPMATTLTEIDAIISAVRSTGLMYMMGETSYYNPATVFAREKHREGAFGRVFYAEGDYLHDMDLGFYAAYQYSGGADWKATASYPPMLYPTHSIGGVLGAIPERAVSVSCTGVVDQRGDGVFDKNISAFDNDFSNATALFELSDGAVLRTNEMRRVGYPAHLRESRFRYFGTEASFEQLARYSVWNTKEDSVDMSEQFVPLRSADQEEGLDDVDPALREAFTSGSAPVHDRRRLPCEFDNAPNGHEGSHHFLADDFVRSVLTGVHPPVNAWRAAMFTAPGIVAHASALAGGERMIIPDFGAEPGCAAPERYQNQRGH